MPSRYIHSRLSSPSPRLTRLHLRRRTHDPQPLPVARLPLDIRHPRYR